MTDDKKPERRTNYEIKAFPSQIEAWLTAAERFAKWTPPRVGAPGGFSMWTRAALNAAANGGFSVSFTEREIVPRGPRGPRGEERRIDDETVEPHQFRASKSEIMTWQNAALAEGLELAEWCRQVLDAAAKISGAELVEWAA